MVADAPIAAARPFSDIADKVTAFLVTAKVSARDGLTWMEFGALVAALVRLSVETLDAVLGMSGAQKKALVLEAVAALFDQLADKAVPVVVWPVWILARPAIRALVLAIASGAIEIVLPLTRAAE